MQNDEAQKALSRANVTYRVSTPVLAPLRYLYRERCQTAGSLGNVPLEPAWLCCTRNPQPSTVHGIIMFHAVLCQMRSYESYRADTTDRCCPHHAHALTISFPTSLVRCA